MKKATTKTKAKATAKAAVKKTEPAKSDKMEKLNKLERALAENQISKTEYDMWRVVYAKEIPFNPNIIVEEDHRPRKKRRRSY